MTPGRGQPGWCRDVPRLVGALLILAGCGDAPAGSNDPALPAELVSPVTNAHIATNPDAGPDAPAPDDDPDQSSDVFGLEPDAGAVPSDAGSDSPLVSLIELQAVSPTQGSTAGDTELLIIGLNFTPDAEVFLGGEACAGVDVIDETKIVCRTPANPAGAYDVKVLSERGQDSLDDAFTYVAAPRIDAIEPARGETTGGMPISVQGVGFDEQTQLSIGGRLLISQERLSASEIRGLTPTGEVGAQTVRASGPNGLDEWIGGFTYLAPLTVEHVVPAVGTADGGEMVTLTGSGFGESAPTVYFGLLPATDVALIDGRTLTLRTPAGPADGWIDVEVARDGQLRTLVDGFYYYAGDPERALLAVRPAFGPVDGGNEVMLSGVGLDAVVEVEIDGTPAAPEVVDDRFVVVTAPPGSPGLVDVVAWDDEGTEWRLDGAYEYRPVLRVDSLSPDAGPIDGGTEVRVSGVGFVDGMTVRVGALQATDVQWLGERTLSAQTPPGSPGPARVEVRHPDGRIVGLDGGFEYTTELAVHGFTPTRGSVAGNTYVRIYGQGFREPLAIKFDGQPAPSVTIMDSATVAVRTPPHEPAFADVTLEIGAGSAVRAVERYLYFDPLSGTGGVWGDDILGAVNVTVTTELGPPLEDAFVMLNVRDEAVYRGVTDSNGQVTLSGPDLSGAQVVSASRPGFSSSVVYDTNAENITISLMCAPDGTCTEDSQCRDGFVCANGACLDPRCVGQSGGGGIIQSGLITGQLTGLDKVGDPGPGEIYLGVVYTTQEGPWSVFRARPDLDNAVIGEDGPYTLASRIGSLALVAVCGFYNDDARSFTPIRMGVARGLFVSGSQTYDVDLDCDIWLDQELLIKATGAPLRMSEDPEVIVGPNGYVHSAYLDFGAEGFFGGLITHEGTDETLVAAGFPTLEGPLADVTYYVRGGAYTNRSWPYSIAYLRGAVPNSSGLLVLPQFVPPAELTTPDPAADEIVLTGGFMEWVIYDDPVPDFWDVQIRDIYGVEYWRLVMPGDRMFLNLPAWPEDAETGWFPAGGMLAVIRGVNAYDFDIDHFDNNDFTSANWHSYSIAAFSMVNPEPTP